MAHRLMNDLMNLKDSPKDVISWLTSDEFGEMQWLKFSKICTKEEFIFFFLNYLQDQFGSVIQTACGTEETPAKKILSHLRTSKFNEPAKKDAKVMKNTPLSTPDIIRKSASVSQSNNISGFSNNSATSIIHDLSESDNFRENSQVISNSTFRTSNNSTPLVKTNSVTKAQKRVELKSCSPNQLGNINPAFQENCDYEQADVSRNISSYEESFPSLESSTSVGVSAYSTPIKDDSLNRSYSNRKSSSSVSNHNLQSPLSSLHNDSLFMISPIHSKFQYVHNNSQKNYRQYKQNSTSTPDRSQNSGSKNSKNYSRQNISLGNFIGAKSRSAKKSSGKKSNKMKTSCNEQSNEEDKRSVFSDTSNNRTKQKRKVNPTSLDVTNEKGTNENTAFGDVSRPFTQNPQFVDVPPIDKSADNESFQVERGLIKIERQKKPEPCLDDNKDTKKDLTDEKNESRWKRFPRTSQKTIKPVVTITPNRTLVENIEILNVLAEVYSGFLDHNLVLNPMTELYFIIYLITVQYTNTEKLKSLVKQSTEDKIENDSLNSLKKSSSSLRKSLNFDSLSDNTLDNNIKNDMENKVQDNKFLQDCDSINLASMARDNLNMLDNKVKLMTVSETDDSKVNDARDNRNLEGSESTDNYVEKNFNNPHNCVYFSTQVLNLQREFLKCLDRVTLKLLCENSLIGSYQPELCEYLDLVYNIKVTEANKMKSVLSIGTVDLNVCFQIETDNCNEFPTPVAFSSFRKQRDMFYDILKFWKDNHLLPGSNFKIALDSKIRSILGLNADVTNLTHFTRLFKSQMLISCIQSRNQEDLDEETVSFLKNLKDSNPGKFTQLQQKLITPLSQNGPVPLPSFPGIQEFYKNFILLAANPSFYTYLENTFVHEIMELNNSHFVGSDVEEKETDVDEQTKQNFILCMSKLKLLAKFLGFMIALPYKSETSMLKNVISSQVMLRSECLPRIDLQYCLQSALVLGKLSLTVPWLVEYLAMMDHASLRLPYYKKVLEMLYCIYRASNYLAATNEEELMSQKTAILLKLSIGWLFELPVFPVEFYCIWQSKYNSRVLKMIRETQVLNTKADCESLTDAETSMVSVKHNLFLDKLEIVDDVILYNCCPFLKELNILLISGKPNVNSASYRHVTPVSSQLEKSNLKKTSAKNLEIQLEEAFFHGQPMSTRKTVDYVAERVASSCVKYIRDKLLPVERQNNSEAVKEMADKNYNKFSVEDTELIINYLSKDIDAISAKAVKNIKERTEEVIPGICEARVTQSITALLSEDCLNAVKNMCIKIATRMALDRIDQWIWSHIVGSSIFTKDIVLELKKACKLDDEVIVDKKYHNQSAPSPTEIIDEIKHLIFELLESRGMLLTQETLSKFWNRLHACLTERSDLKSIPEKMIIILSIDLCLFSMTYRPELFTDEVQEKVLRAWKIDRLKIFKADTPLSRLLSPRNIELMVRSGNNDVWLICGKFMKKLLKENILPINDLCEQAVAVLRTDWDTGKHQVRETFKAVPEKFLVLALIGLAYQVQTLFFLLRAQ
ncbi:codanin-1 [Copidosoma floridanum]|uniref:codanin-1 n=1 Tax=Copidosoma floridanum TaxID=29053 RepID=UPI0006C9DE6C|nr:codanin-1 [Copidosoma floridanum]